MVFGVLRHYACCYGVCMFAVDGVIGSFVLFAPVAAVAHDWDNDDSPFSVRLLSLACLQKLTT